MSHAIRAERVGPPGFLREVRETIASVNPRLPAQSVRTLEMILFRGMARTSFMLAMLEIAAEVAFVLALVGVYGVDSADPITFAIVAASLVAATLAACFLPAQRAARIGPIRALRSE